MLADHEAQRVEGAFCTARVQCRDAAGVARDHAAEIGKRRSVAQLLHQHAVRTHPQAAFEQILASDLCGALIALRIEQCDAVAMWNAVPLGCVLDRDQSLVQRDRFDQGLGDRRLPRPGCTRDQDVLLSEYGLAELLSPVVIHELVETWRYRRLTRSEQPAVG